MEKHGLHSFWSWENKILKQEQEYFQNLIDGLDAQITQELEATLAKSEGENSAVADFNAQIRAEVEKKYE